MSFNTLEFGVFFIIVYALYLALKHKWQVKKNLFISNFKKLPDGLLLALLDFKIENMISQTQKYQFDILILGECYARVGIIPRIIEEKTGFPCYNFSTHAEHTVLASYCILKNYLKTHSKKPKYLIIGFDRRIYKISEPELRYLHDFAKGNIKVFIEEFGMLRTARFFMPSLNHQSIFKRIIKEPFLSVKTLAKGSIDAYIKHYYLVRGHSAAWKPNEVYTGNETDSGYKKEYDFSVSGFSLKYLKRILGLAEQNNIKIIYLVTTSPPDWHEIFEKYGHINQRNNFVSLLEKQYPDLIVLDPQEMLNEKEMYSTRNHLNRKGQELLSNLLALKINELESKYHE